MGHSRLDDCRADAIALDPLEHFVRRRSETDQLAVRVGMRPLVSLRQVFDKKMPRSGGTTG
jgi:hypothetical protein